MKWAGIVGLGRKFQGATKSGGLGLALRKSIKGVACRCGLVSQDELERLVGEVRAEQSQTSLAQQDELMGLVADVREQHDQATLAQQDEFKKWVNSITGDLERAQTSLKEIEKQNLTFLTDSNEARAAALSIANNLAKVQGALTIHSESIKWLAEHHWTTGPLNPPLINPEAGPLVSIILPVWNREELVKDAIESVQRQIYTNWELIVIDDGSTDRSAEEVARFLGDGRIRLLSLPHRGVSAARNAGLADSRGDLIAYVDSDDVWYPAFLARMVAAFAEAPNCDWAYAAKLFSDLADGPQRIFQLPIDRGDLMWSNAIPMTSLIHRRSLYERLGGFDETLNRLVDWDLVLRFISISEPMSVPVMAGQHRMGSWPRITNQESPSLAYYKVRQKHLARNERPARVLYALQFFPQLSETFVITEISAMREQGIDIVVWSEYDPPVPFECDVPVVRGDLGEAIAQVRPSTVHVHSLYHAQRYAPMVNPTGVPMTVRGHGFEYSEELLQEVSTTAAVRAVFEFPHFITGRKLEGVETKKLRAMTACFNPNSYFPKGESDSRLVVRAGLASPSKHMDAFIRIAAMCPRHRFVLVPCWSVGYPDHLEELQSLNRSLGEPVEILPNRRHEEAAELFQRAGIHLHTHTLQDPYGMPVSIAESMAAGCYVIARRCPASIEYVGDAGKTYDTEAEAAALVLETEYWTKEEWAAARLASVDRAFTHYPSQVVLRPLLDEWTGVDAGAFTATA